MSREHHWWPVSLQSHWSTLGKVRWIDIDGKVHAKQYANRKIAKKAHGHSILPRENPWHTNFENEFQKIDDQIHNVVRQCRRPFTHGFILKLFWSAFRNRLKGRSDLAIFLRKGQMDEQLRRNLTFVCISLLIRSPRNRYIWERAGSSMGFLPDEETGKLNMLTQVREMNSKYNNGYTKNVFPLVMYSIRKEFIFGDGLFDTIGHSRIGWIHGVALVPLTPHICIFLGNPRSVRSDRNAGFLVAPDWLVDEINEITQIYSRDTLFFATQKPELSRHFQLGEHRELHNGQNETVELLKTLCGEQNTRWRGFLELRR